MRIVGKDKVCFIIYFYNACQDKNKSCCLAYCAVRVSQATPRVSEAAT